ncbi:MAG: hypothetical protein HUJ61_04940, partial [Bacilli bacterium]|nr:hypothetical protein [Bacilli bacterium]
TLDVTGFEFEIIKKFYDIEYQIEEEIYFRKCNFLQKYILELYEKKKLYKQQKDEANLGLTKIALNSIYGKFAQAPMRNQVYYLTKEQLKRK